jgi:hypothetical protein
MRDDDDDDDDERWDDPRDRERPVTLFELEQFFARSGIPPQAGRFLLELMRKHQDQDGRPPDPDELLRREPGALNELHRLMLELAWGRGPRRPRRRRR